MIDLTGISEEIFDHVMKMKKKSPFMMCFATIENLEKFKKIVEKKLVKSKEKHSEHKHTFTQEIKFKKTTKNIKWILILKKNRKEFKKLCSNYMIENNQKTDDDDDDDDDDLSDKLIATFQIKINPYEENKKLKNSQIKLLSKNTRKKINKFKRGFKTCNVWILKFFVGLFIIAIIYEIFSDLVND